MTKNYDHDQKVEASNGASLSVCLVDSQGTGDRGTARALLRRRYEIWNRSLVAPRAQTPDAGAGSSPASAASLSGCSGIVHDQVEHRVAQLSEATIGSCPSTHEAREGDPNRDTTSSPPGTRRSRTLHDCSKSTPPSFLYRSSKTSSVTHPCLLTVTLQSTENRDSNLDRSFCTRRPSMHGPRGLSSFLPDTPPQAQNPERTNAMGCVSRLQYLSGENSSQTPWAATTETPQIAKMTPVHPPTRTVANLFICPLPPKFSGFPIPKPLLRDSVQSITKSSEPHEHTSE